ncbi:MarR family winged helix-turn-helix transcriptional regulator [Cyanobium sp. Morenito 9A2]|uniref:MarR family winged helix-turn-helix transcriptional regulator n=1 Tax=Cyanobium sp. Morenito 9A2 TaxID=2823718 RepID=UPI0020CB8CD0|nr:MarR family transcriptional regulator [Cyanobium sp. Morenito 9A2]MCP9848746.1 MarR family transcriptional regulator [Cyanobium sp. Morenito 9A2]
MASDRIDQSLSQWQQASPALDVSALAVVGRILRLARRLERQREALLAPHGLSLWSFDVLAALRRQPPPHQLTPTELYGALMLSSGAMTNRIDRLEGDGLVERHRETTDRRSVLVRLTARGAQLVETVLPVIVGSERERLEQCTTSEERELLAGLLRRQLLALDAGD